MFNFALNSKSFANTHQNYSHATLSTAQIAMPKLSVVKPMASAMLTARTQPHLLTQTCAMRDSGQSSSNLPFKINESPETNDSSPKNDAIDQIQPADQTKDQVYLSKGFRQAIESTLASPSTTTNHSIDREPKLFQKAQRIVRVFTELQNIVPKPLVNSLFNKAKSDIRTNSIETSFIAKGLEGLLDNLQLNSGRTVNTIEKEESIYCLLKCLDIFDQAIEEIDGHADKKLPLISSLALSGLDNIISSPSRFDRFGMMNIYTRLVNLVTGDNSKGVNDLVTGFKDRLLTSIGKEDPESFSAQLKTFLYLAICIDTGQPVETKDFVNAVQNLGVIVSKIAQTLGNQVNNPLLEDGGNRSRLLQACKELQQYNKPMSAADAKIQMAEFYGQALGDNWQSSMFKSIDFTKPYRTGTIAGVYKAVTTDNQDVIVKIKKPHLQAALATNKAQLNTLLTALYAVVQETIDSYSRLGKDVPKLLDQANLFQRSQASTNSFFERFQTELDFEQEAQAMQSTQCKTPAVISFTPNTIIMQYIDGGVSPLEFIEISNLAKPVNYKAAPDMKTAVEGWLQTHYPHRLHSNNAIEFSPSGADVRVHFADGAINPLDINLRRQGGQWQVKPVQKYIDYSRKSRDMIATQSIGDLLTQLAEGKLNCDTHGGNFIISPGQKPGKNAVYNIDFGLTATIDSNERSLAWNFIKGFLFKNEQAIAKSYLNMTSRSATLNPEDYATTVTEFTKVLKDSQYTKMVAEDPEKALGPVMEWLAGEGFDIDSKFYAIIRSFSGVATNAIALQGGQRVTPNQIFQLSNQLLHKNKTGDANFVQDFVKVIQNSQATHALTQLSNSIGAFFRQGPNPH